MVDLSSLNDMQKEAVLYNEGPMTILSVAGSGKTRTLTTKIAYLIKELGMRPGHIWACTFTKKAAGEMQERLEAMIGEEAQFVKMSTIHSLAFKIWRQGKRSKEPWFETPKLLTNEGAALAHLFKFLKNNKFINKDAKDYLSRIAINKLQEVTPKIMRQRIEANTTEPVDWENPENLRFDEALYLVYKEYENWKAKRNYMDFNDMLVQCLLLLENPTYADFVAKVQSTVRYLLVDEAQDTNGIAFKIMKILGDREKNIAIIGDLRQSIYSFQGAEISNIKQFIHDYKPKMINLSINYRSTQTIVENANQLIKYSTEVIGEPATTPNVKGDRIEQYGTYNLIHEGQRILDLVREIKETEGCEWRDIAVLYRVHSLSREIEDQFLLNEIPYVIFTKTSFFDRKEIKDLVSYLQLAMNPDEQDIKVFKRIANRPLRYISNATINALDDIAEDMERTPWQVMKDAWNQEFSPKEAQQIDGLHADIARIRRYISQGKTTAEIFRYILEEIGYKKWAIDEKKQRAEADDDVEMNFESLVSSVSKFAAPIDFLNFLEEVKAAEKKKKDENGNYVKMMSVHASKGKEFPYVIITGLNDRTYPFYKAVEEGKTDEERRIMYVALTRPKKKLYLSHVIRKLGNIKVKMTPYMGQMNVDAKDIEIDFHAFDEMEIEDEATKGRSRW